MKNLYQRLIISAFFYAISLILFQYIFNLQNTNIRIASFLAPIFGIMWGLIGSIGVGLGNFIADLTNSNFQSNYVHFYLLGSFGNFLSAYLNYFLWNRLFLNKDDNPFAINLKNMLRYIAIQFIVVTLTSLYLICVNDLIFNQTALFDLFLTITVNNFDVNVLLGLPILLFLMSSNYEIQNDSALSKPIYYKIAKGFCIFMVILVLIMSINAIMNMQGDYSSNEIWFNFYKNTFLVLHFTLAIQLILIGYIEKSVIKPLNEITKTAVKITNSDPEREKISFEVVNSGDELELLSKTLHKMQESIYKYITNLKQTLTERERTKAQLEIAMNIQAALLPSPKPLNEKFSQIKVEALMNPALMIGGDFYDLKIVDDDHIVIVVSDISDKGIPAALFMTITHTLIHHKISSGENISLPKIFSETNNQLCENNDTEMFATAVAVLYEISTGKMIYVNAGHTSPLIVHADGSFEYLKKRSGAMLGSMEDNFYKELETKLIKGDLLVLYSDGVTEALNEDEEFYQEKRLAETVKEIVLNDQKDEIAPTIRKDIKKFVGKHSQSDDITIVTLKILKSVEKSSSKQIQ